MGQAKHEMELREQGQFDAAERDDRRCPYCGTVVPDGTEFGQHGECPACVGALKDD